MDRPEADRRCGAGEQDRSARGRSGTALGRLRAPRFEASAAARLEAARSEPSRPAEARTGTRPRPKAQKKAHRGWSGSSSSPSPSASRWSSGLPDPGLLHPVRVDGSDAEEDDRVLVNKLAYRLHDVQRGDIIVFHAPPGRRHRRRQGPHQAGRRPARRDRSRAGTGSSTSTAGRWTSRTCRPTCAPREFDPRRSVRPGARGLRALGRQPPGLHATDLLQVGPVDEDSIVGPRLRADLAAGRHRAALMQPTGGIGPLADGRHHPLHVVDE